MPRVIVYCHGACEHAAGFSDYMFAALKPWTTAYGDGELGVTRFEVLWSDLINQNIQAFVPASPETLPFCLRSFFQYLNNIQVRIAIINRFVSVVQPLIDAGNQVDIMAHSEGTIVSYEGLRSFDYLATKSILNYFTIGAALGFRYGLFGYDNVRNHLLMKNQDGIKPGIVQAWWNICAQGDPFGSALHPAYGVTKDFVNLPAVGCPQIPVSPLCYHESYFNPNNLAVNRDILGKNINTRVRYRRRRRRARNTT